MGVNLGLSFEIIERGLPLLGNHAFEGWIGVFTYDNECMKLSKIMHSPARYKTYKNEKKLQLIRGGKLPLRRRFWIDAFTVLS